MPVEQLLCPGCGADLDVPEGVSVLRCQFCKSKLKLAESETVRALTLLEQGIAEVAQHGARAADGIDALRAETEEARKRTFQNWQFQRDALVSQYEDLVARNRRIAKREGKKMSRAVFIIIGLGVFFFIGSWVDSKPGDHPDMGTIFFLIFTSALIVGAVTLKVMNDSNAKARASRTARLNQINEDIKAWDYRQPL